jgi:phosphinothricin acetyltransferase
MAGSLEIRSASIADTPALLEIYRPFVEATAVSFEVDAPSVDEFEARIANALDRFAWLVAIDEHRVVGYAYASTHRERAAYRWSVETSAYIDPAFHRKGIGRRLYAALFDALVAKGYHCAYAGIALPNAASEALHRAVGFEAIGVFREVGHKFGRWHDVSWWQRRIT